MIYVLYGQPASGKTVLGRMLASHLLTTYHIDGDEFRQLFHNKNYGRKGREENITAANAVATYLNKTQEGDVVFTLVNPYKDLRDELKKNNSGQVLEILLSSNRALRKEYHVEDFETGMPRFTLNTDREPYQSWESLKVMVEGRMVNAQWR
jgi:adenylylsulfate kinase-like enzyme